MSRQIRYSYHPIIPLAFHLSLLPADCLSKIPRSTKHDWKQKNLSQLFGHDFSIQQSTLLETLHTVALNRQLLAVNRALIRVIAVKRFILKNTLGLAKKQEAVIRVVTGTLTKTFGILGFLKTLKLCDLSYSRFLGLKNIVICTSSYIRMCRRKHPAQLLREETDKIVAICNNPKYSVWPLASIYHLALRKKIISCSLFTFYKYAALLVNRKPLPEHRRKNNQVGIRASNPLEIIHADVTQFVSVDNKKSYIYLIQDNYSRAILAYKVTNERKAIHTLELIRHVRSNSVNASTLGNCFIITDDGCENKRIAEAFRLSDPVSITHQIAQKDIIFSNSMIEHLNKTIKYHYLYQQPIADIKVLKQILDNAVVDYNNRPSHVLNGLTPLEALKNQKVDTIQIREQIQEAARNRILVNKSNNCCINNK